MPFVPLTAAELLRPCPAVRTGSCAPGIEDLTSPDFAAQNEAAVLMVAFGCCDTVVLENGSKEKVDVGDLRGFR